MPNCDAHGRSLGGEAAHDSLADMVSWVTQNNVMSASLIPTENTFVTIRLGRGATGFGCGDPIQPLSDMG